MKEDLITIGKNIKHHRDEEIRFSSPYLANARANCMISLGNFQRNQIVWLATTKNNQGVARQLPNAPEITISKNSPLGGAIIMGRLGKHLYSVPKTRNVCDLEIYNFCDYIPSYGSVAKDITIELLGDANRYKYQTIEQLIGDAFHLKERLKREAIEKKRLEEEKIKAQLKEEAAREAARKSEEEERKRLEEEARRLKELRKQKEEEERKKAEEIERLEADYKNAQERIKSKRNFIRNEATLRSQHILDPSQEDAKRSHLYDGVPMVIEGGPGTGKTTTMIQRLKFLLDVDALNEYESPLTEEQKNQLVNNIANNWLFFSPTTLLLKFSMNNMNEEGLSAVEGKNIITIDDFRRNMLRAYHLFNVDTNGPFRTFKQSHQKILLWKPDVAIKEFEKFCIKNSVKILLAASEMNTSEHAWHKDSFGIKAICKDASKVKDIEGLMRLFNSLYEHEYKGAIAKEAQLAELVKKAAFDLQTLILQNEAITTDLKTIFKKWDNERIGEVADAEEDEMDESNEEENNIETDKMDFEPRLFNFLKGLLKAVALRQIDTKIKVSGRQKLVYDKIEALVKEINLREIGELAFFSKKYAFLCKGIESNLINQLPRLYKVYRKLLVANETANYYDRALLAKLINKDKNKHLHYDEQDLLIGYINNLAMFIRKRSKERYAQMVKRCKYIRAYDENKKPVIGIDEATDYTVMDYYFMYSFRNYEYSSVTLCGDIMQGLHKYGIRDWSEIKSVIPDLEIRSLKISYRQIPTLVEMAKKIYFSERGEMPPYNSRDVVMEGDFKPLAFISDDDDEKIEWIVERLRDVYKDYGNQIPSVAIFIPNGRNVDAFVNQLLEQDDLGEIKVSAGKNTNITEAVKVYELSEVKGMEFEVAFFYDLDEALKGDDTQLMKRHLYVGISRATSHLYAIFNEEEGNEELLEYFSGTDY